MSNFLSGGSSNATPLNISNKNTSNAVAKVAKTALINPQELVNSIDTNAVGLGDFMQATGMDYNQALPLYQAAMENTRKKQEAAVQEELALNTPAGVATNVKDVAAKGGLSLASTVRNAPAAGLGLAAQYIEGVEEILRADKVTGSAIKFVEESVKDTWVEDVSDAFRATIGLDDTKVPDLLRKASKAIYDASDRIDKMGGEAILSEGYQLRSERMSRTMEEATKLADTGDITGALGKYADAAIENPTEFAGLITESIVPSVVLTAIGMPVPVAAALTEGISSAGQAEDIIDQLSDKELLATEFAKNNPDLSIADLRTKMSVDMASDTGLKTGLVAALISKFVGSGSEQRLAGKATTKLTAAKAAKELGQEGLEEGLTSGYGTVAENISKREYLDKNQQLGEGVLGSVVEGAVIGTAASGGISTLAGSVNAVETITGKSGDILAAGAQKLADKVDNDPASTNNFNKEVSELPEEAAAYTEVAKKVQSNLVALSEDKGNVEKQQALYESISEMAAEVNNIQDEELKGKVTAPDKFFRSALSTLAVKDSDKTSIIDALKAGTELTEEQAESIKPLAAKVLYHSNISTSGLLPSGDVDVKLMEALEAVLNDSGLLATVPEKVKVNAQAKLTELKSMAQVSNDIVKGNGTVNFFKGVEQYTVDAREAVIKGDMQTAQKEIDNFNKFTTNHTEKAKKVRAAFEEAKSQLAAARNAQYNTSEEQQAAISQAEQGFKFKEYRQLEEASDGSYQPTGKPLRVHAGSRALVETIEKEVEYLQSASKYINTITNPTISTEVTEVQQTEEVQDVSRVQNESNESSTSDSTERTETTTDIVSESESVSNNVSSDGTGQQLDLFTGEVSEQVAEIETNTPAVNPDGLDTLTTNTELIDNSVLSEVDNTSENFPEGNPLVNLFRATNNSPMSQISGLTSRLVYAGLERTKDALNKFFDTSRVNSADMQVLKDFEAFKSLFEPVLRRALETKAIKPIDFPSLNLLDVDGKMPQRVIDAMAISAWNWMMYESGNAAYNTPEQIHMILGGNGDIEVRDSELAEVGSVKSTVQDYMRNQLLTAMGISPTKDAQTAFYDHFVGDLIETTIWALGTPDKGNNKAGRLGFIKNTAVPQKVFASKQEEAGIPEEKWTTTGRSFIKLAVDLDPSQVRGNPEHIAYLGVARENAFTKSTRITEKIANPNINNESLFIGKAPKRVKAVRVKGTDRVVAKEMVEAHNKANNRKYFPNTALFNSMFSLGDDFVRSMLGYESTEFTNQNGTTISRGLSQTNEGRKGLNQTINSAISKAKGFFEQYSEHPEGTPVFFDHEFASQTRHMMKGAFNPQREKLHRYLIGFKPVTYKINTRKSINSFKYAVAQGLGFDFDKDPNSLTIIKLNLAMHGKFAPAIREMRNLINGRDVNQEVLLEAIKSGKEKTASFKALYEYARFIEAKENGDKTFDSDIMIEIDGVTNGPFHAIMQLGLRGSSEEVLSNLKRGGLYQSVKKVSHNLLARKNDTYMATSDFASKWLRQNMHALEPTVAHASNIFMEYSESIMKLTADGFVAFERKAGKNPTTTVTYGSGKRSNDEKLLEQTLDGLFSKVDELILEIENGAENPAQLLEEAYDHVIKFTSLTSQPLNKPKTFTQNELNVLKEFKFTNNQKKELVTLYGKGFGTAIEEGINNTLGQVRFHGQLINNMTAIMHELHRSYVDEQIEEARRTDLGLTFGDVDRILSENRQYAPGMRPFFSEEGKHSEYIQLSERTTKSGAPVLNSKGKVAQAVGGSSKIYSSVPTYSEPGVKGLPLGTIQLDAAQSMFLNLSSDINHLNVWDGFYVTPNNLSAMGRALNTSDLTVNQNYDLFNEVVNQLEYVLENSPALNARGADAITKSKLLVDLITNNIPDYQKDNLNTLALDIFLEDNSGDVVNNLIVAMRSIGNDLQASKAEATKNASYSQFVADEGNAVTTDSEGNIQNTTEKAQKAIAASIKSAVKEPKPLKTLSDEANLFNISEGTVFTGAEQVNGLIELAEKSLPNAHNDVTAIRKALANSLKNLRNDNVTVRFTNFNTDSDIASLNDFNKKSHGATLRNPDGSIVVLINTALDVAVDTSSVAETVLHELVHANTASTVDTVILGQPNKITKRQFTAVKGIEALAKQLVEEYSNNILKQKALPPSLRKYLTKYSDALRNNDLQGQTDSLNEILAWGLSNEGVAYYFSKRKSQETKGIKAIVGNIVKWIQRLLGVRVNPSQLLDLYANFYNMTIDNAPSNTGGQILYQATYETDTRSIFDNLEGSKDPEHNEHLTNVLNNIEQTIITKLENNYGEDIANIEIASEKVLLDQLNPNVRTTVNKLVGVGFNMSAKESMVYQLYADVLQTGFVEEFHKKTEIRKIYEQAKSVLTFRDFLDTQNPTYADVQLAYDKYNAVFNSKDAEVDYLSNFAALAVSNAQLRTALDTKVEPEVIEVKQVTGVINKIERFIKNMFAKLVDWMTYGSQRKDKVTLAKLDNLTKRIVHIKAKSSSIIDSGLEKANTVGNSADSLIKAAVRKVARGIEPYAPKVRGVNTLVGTLDGLSKDNPNLVQSAIKSIINAGGNKPLNALRELGGEITGVSEESSPLLELQRTAKYQTEAKREDIHKAVAENIHDAFSKELSEEESRAITNLVRADIGSLVENGFTLAEIAELASDPAKLIYAINKEINALKAQKVPKSTVNFYINSAKGLGKYMATGMTFLKYQLPNALAIAEGVGTNFKTEGNDAIKHIDNLASLTALLEMDTSIGAELLKTESARTTVNGFHHVLRKHKQIKQKEIAHLGDGAKYSQVKGYVYEITNPNRSVTYGEAGDTKLHNRGYTQARKLRKDSLDNSGDTYIYVSEDAGNVSFVSGAMSTIISLVSGTDPESGKVGSKKLPNYTGYKAEVMHKAKAKDIANLGNELNLDNSVDALIPTLGMNGKVVGYRYELDAAYKDAFLERDNDIGEVLGAWEGRIDEAQQATKYNKELVDVLKNRYEDANEAEKRKFIAINSRSKNPKHKDLWHLMPKEMKEAAKNAFGSYTIYVHKEDLNNALGYREMTVLNLWDAQDRNKLAKIAVTIAEHILPGNSAAKLRKGERFIQELVSEVKDWIIVKSIIVSAANIFSNAVQMYLRGVSLRDMREGSVEAIEAVTQYRELSAELNRVQDKLDVETRTGDITKLSARANQLKQDLLNNPVHEFVERGLLPKVAEDLSAQDKFSIKNSLVSKLSNHTFFTKPTPDGVLSNLALTRESKTYEGLNTSIELGDFVAKYTVFKHWVNNEGVSRDDAFKRIGVEFIDYGALSSTTLDYTNKMGLTNFFKYFIRIHPVIASIIADKPARVLTVLLGQGASGIDVADPLDSIGADLGAKTGLIDLLRGFGAHPLMNAL